MIFGKPDSYLILNSFFKIGIRRKWDFPRRTQEDYGNQWNNTFKILRGNCFYTWNLYPAILSIKYKCGIDSVQTGRSWQKITFQGPLSGAPKDVHCEVVYILEFLCVCRKMFNILNTWLRRNCPSNQQIPRDCQGLSWEQAFTMQSNQPSAILCPCALQETLFCHHRVRDPVTRGHLHSPHLGRKFKIKMKQNMV